MTTRRPRPASDDLTITDLFCGAGGSSSGATKIPGVRVRMAANHWDVAIDTHQTNHPDADHDIADLSQVDPRRYPRTRILWASPSCTNHTQAKGVSRAAQVDEWNPYDGRPLPKEAAERSRATMWDVPRFAEFHHYDAVVVENVVDAAKWVLFPAWLHAMEALGYEHEIVWLNSMHAQAYGMPAPQSRDRMYVVFWRRGNRRPDLAKWTRPFAVCPEHGTVQCVQTFKRTDGTRWGRYRAQYVYRCPRTHCPIGILEPGWLPASSVIDWSLRGHRIGDRAKPLAPKTRERIRLGIARHWGPLVIEAAGNAYDSTSPKHRAHGDPNGYVRAWPTSEPVKTIHTTQSKALVVAAAPPPLLVPVEGRDRKVVATATGPLRTQSTRNETALLIPMRNHNTSKQVREPLDTVAAAGNHHALLMRNQSGGAEMTTPTDQPIRTLTTRGDQSLLAPTEPMSTDVDDCEFRTLEPDEIKRGMAFDDDYVLLGSKRAQVRLAGNAVTPPAARDLIAAVAESLGTHLELAPSPTTSSRDYPRAAHSSGKGVRPARLPPQRKDLSMADKAAPREGAEAPTLHLQGIVATTPKVVVDFHISTVTFLLAVPRDGAATAWYRATATGNLANNLLRSVRKADRLVLTGTVSEQEGRQSDGEPAMTALTVQSAGHDLDWGASTWYRTPRRSYR